MSETTEINCPHCQKMYRIAADKIGREVLCRNCQQKFVAESPVSNPSNSLFNPPGGTANNQQSLDANWSLADSQGQTYNGLSWNDLLNYALQSRLTMQMSIYHPTKTGNQWKPVSQFSELTNLMPNKGPTVPPQMVPSPFKPAPPKSMFGKASINSVRIPLLISVIFNSFVGLFWCYTICGTPLGVVSILLAGFEALVFDRAKYVGKRKLKEWLLPIGIVEIFSGLWNPPTLICGVIVLVNRSRL